MRKTFCDYLHRIFPRVKERKVQRLESIWCLFSPWQKNPFMSCWQPWETKCITVNISCGRKFFHNLGIFPAGQRRHYLIVILTWRFELQSGQTLMMLKWEGKILFPLSFPGQVGLQFLYTWWWPTTKKCGSLSTKNWVKRKKQNFKQDIFLFSWHELQSSCLGKFKMFRAIKSWREKILWVNFLCLSSPALVLWKWNSF